MDRAQLARRFEDQRPRLQRVAYRMLGSWADADDAVQEAWLRLQRSDADPIGNLDGWLTTTVSRLCLDRLRSRRARPESPTGEPPDRTEAPDDPAGEAELADAVGRALTVVLDTLSPAERVAFVLHDVFGVPFGEIATVLGRSTEATKKLGARARRRTRLHDGTHAGDVHQHRRVIQAFLDALRAGDVAAAVRVLAPDATRSIDPVLIPAGSPRTVRGAHAIAEEARTLSAPAHGARLATVDGRPGAAVVVDGTPVLAMTFTILDGRIQAFEVVATPDRLDAMSIVPEP